MVGVHPRPWKSNGVPDMLTGMAYAMVKGRPCVARARDAAGRCRRRTKGGLQDSREGEVEWFIAGDERRYRGIARLAAARTGGASAEKDMAGPGVVIWRSPMLSEGGARTRLSRRTSSTST